MNKTILILICIWFNKPAISQQIPEKERASFLAREEFSKSKYMKKEKYGITKELSKVITSTPVIKENLKDYSGIYNASDVRYSIGLKIRDEKNIQATLTEIDSNSINHIYSLKNISIKDALFKATRINPDGSEFFLEGVFIDKNDNGHIDFGLGLKLLDPLTIRHTIHTDKIFLLKSK